MQRFEQEWEEEEFGCLGVPSEEQMLRQHLRLLEEEWKVASEQLRKARQNIRRLVDQHERVALDRSRLRVKVEELKRRIEWLESWIEAHPQPYEPQHPTWNTKSKGIECYPVRPDFDPWK
ncbi:hypothetical protein D3C84_670640 [compost metagenome]